MHHQDGCHLLFLGPSISAEDNNRGQCHPCRLPAKGMYTSFSQCAQGPEAKQLSPGAQTSSLIHAHVRAPMETGGGKGVLVVQGSSHTQEGAARLW